MPLDINTVDPRAKHEDDEKRMPESPTYADLRGGS